MKKPKSGHLRKRHKTKITLIIVCTLLLLVLLPPLVNLFLTTEAFLFPSFFGFVNSENIDAWIGFMGALIGGIITLAGVAWTIIDQETKRQEDIKEATKPVLVASTCPIEEIKGIKGDEKSRVFECVLEYKNVGKGILFYPQVYNIEYYIDGKEYGKLHTSLRVNSHLDIGESSSNDLMIVFDEKTLSNLLEILKGRGNTLPLQIIMYVGGKDMYDRNIVSKLIYKSSLTFFSATDIQLPLHKGRYTSVSISDKAEINKIVSNSNPNYNVHQ